ncbi:hypothetical protein [Pontibacter qinzhouensis]|nr:hypothetical protein [Pontibacter qinzhouensis]
MHLQPETGKTMAKAALDRLIRRPAGALRSAEGPSRQLLLDSLNTLF